MARQVQVTVNIDASFETQVISSLSISEDMHSHHSFDIVLSLKALESKKVGFITKSQDFMGKPVSLKFKPQHGGKTPAHTFKGIISEISLNKYAQVESTVTIRGFGSSVILDGTGHTRSFAEKDVKQITNKILGDYPANVLKRKIQPESSLKIPYITQFRESNYQFLSRLASRLGEWFFYDGNQLVLGKPDGEKVDLYLGSSLMHLNFSMEVAPVNFKYQVYSYTDNKVLNSASAAVASNGLDKYGKATFNASQDLFSHEAATFLAEEILDKKSLDDAVKLSKSASTSQMVQVSGTSYYSDLKVGTVITVKEKTTNGEEQYGEYLITSVHHQVDSVGNYQNSFSGIPSSTEHYLRQFPHNHPNIEAQPATVKENNDPEQLGRVRVQFYWQENNEMTPWIRVLQTHSGKDKGFYFIPEIGDEVLVSFEQGHPDHPFVVGSLYHGKTKPSKWADKDNNFKAIKTKSGNELYFSDAPGKEEIRLVNKDAQNEISMSLNGEGKITIKTKGKLEISAKEIIMEAQETISMRSGKGTSMEMQSMNVQSQQSIALKSGQETSLESQKVKMEATTLDMQANATATLKASASLKIESSGEAAVKGALVRIN